MAGEQLEEPTALTQSEFDRMLNRYMALSHAYKTYRGSLGQDILSFRESRDLGELIDVTLARSLTAIDADKKPPAPGDVAAARRRSQEDEQLRRRARQFLDTGEGIGRPEEAHFLGRDCWLLRHALRLSGVQQGTGRLIASVSQADTVIGVLLSQESLNARFLQATSFTSKLVQSITVVQGRPVVVRRVFRALLSARLFERCPQCFERAVFHFEPP